MHKLYSFFIIFACNFQMQHVQGILQSLVCFKPKIAVFSFAMFTFLLLGLNLIVNLGYILFTTRQRSCRNVMFSLVSVILSVHERAGSNVTNYLSTDLTNRPSPQLKLKGLRVRYSITNFNDECFKKHVHVTKFMPNETEKRVKSIQRI